MIMLSTIFSLLLASSGPVDTLHVGQAYVSDPVYASSVYSTDTVNLGGKPLPARHFFETNTRAPFIQRAAKRPVYYGEPLPLAAKGEVLYVVKFRVVADNYTKAELKWSKQGKDFVVYADTTRTNGPITFKPGMTQVSLLCRADSSCRDSFNVSLVGEHLSDLCIMAEGEREPMTLAVMREGEHYSDVRLSPSGKYLITVYYDQSPEGTSEYWTVLTETKSGRILARENGKNNWKWLPKRDLIWYTRSWNKHTQLVYRNPENGQEQVAATDLPQSSFSFSPTEDYLVYSQKDDSRKASGVLRRLEQPDDRMPNWGSRSSLFCYELTTGTIRRLTFGTENTLLQDISPDGKRLLIVFNRMDPSRLPFDRSTLVQMYVGTGRVDTLLLDTTFIADARYSADGNSLYIKGTPDAFGGIGNELPAGMIGNSYDYRLFKYGINTRQATAMLPRFNASVDQVIVPWQGDEIYITVTEGYGHSLWRIDSKTLQRVRYSLPVSTVQRVSIATQQTKPTAVFFGYSGERARDCYKTELASRPDVKCEPVGEVSFDSIYRNVAIGRCIDWNFLSSRGDSIQGFYYLPANFDPAKKYPLIVYYYGGCVPTPKAFEFLYPFPVLAAQGYVVYVVEPSGAAGFSQEFAARHVGTWGKESADDIIEGTQAFCAAHPFINTERIGCIGASYGGFMTQYLQTRTDLFRAAISHAGISNIASYWGGGYWGYTYGQVAQYGQYPWSHPELYTQQSPLFNADKIHTPLLLLHGTVDTNVPPTESQQLFTALRILRRPVSFVQVNGENHVIQNTAKQTLWQEAIFAWFAYWLKDRHEWWRALFPNDDFGVGIRD